MRTLVWMSIGALVLAACGDDDDAPPPPSPRRAAAAAAAKPGARGGSAAPVTKYTKIEARADLKDGEAKTLRHQFTPDDFKPDLTAATNRDPFRSYVIVQVSVNTQDQPQENPDRTEKCANKKVAAPDSSIQQLTLIGVISRGTMRVASFADAAKVGWVVREGDCIGSEHARVTRIGEAYVDVTPPSEGGPPPTATGTPPPVATNKKTYKLRDTEVIDQMGQASDDEFRIRRRPRDTTPPPPPPAELPPAVINGAQ